MSSTQLNSSLLTISVIAVLLPAAFHLSITNSSGLPNAVEASDILKVSHGVSASSDYFVDATIYVI